MQMQWSMNGALVAAEPQRGRGSGERGYSRICYTGVCRPNGLVFHKTPLDMGLLFGGKTLTHGPFFQNVQNFGCLLSKISKSLRCLPNGYLFWGKNDP